MRSSGRSRSLKLKWARRKEFWTKHETPFSTLSADSELQPWLKFITLCLIMGTPTLPLTNFLDIGIILAGNISRSQWFKRVNFRSCNFHDNWKIPCASFKNRQGRGWCGCRLKVLLDVTNVRLGPSYSGSSCYVPGIDLQTMIEEPERVRRIFIALPRDQTRRPIGVDESDHVTRVDVFRR